MFRRRRRPGQQSSFERRTHHRTSPIVPLNRAVAAAEVEGPGVALALVDDLEVEGYYLVRATRA